MRVKDPAWDVFVSELRDHMGRPVKDAQGRQLSRTTSRMLAARLGVDQSLVDNWRQEKVRPRLAQLPQIAEALSMGGGTQGEYDPLFLPRRMGILAPEPAAEQLVDAAYRLQKLELKTAEAAEWAAQQGRGGGAAAIVKAAMSLGDWAVATWPIVDGPADCRMRVADRIDIRRCDNGPVNGQMVWANPTLKSALRASFAVPGSRRPRWSDPGPTVSGWSISHVGSPMSPKVPARYPNLASIAFTSLTVDSWVNDVASLSALAIGYGLTTTRDLAMEASGLTAQRTRPEDRMTAHRARLARTPNKRVWSHHSPLGSSSPEDLFLPPNGAAPRDVLHVRLRESDALLQLHAERPEAAPVTAEQLVADRARIDEVLDANKRLPRVLTIDVDMFKESSDRWTQVLHCVLRVLSELAESDLVAAQDLVAVHENLLQNDPRVGGPLIGWLRAHQP